MLAAVLLWSAGLLFNELLNVLDCITMLNEEKGRDLKDSLEDMMKMNWILSELLLISERHVRGCIVRVEGLMQFCSLLSFIIHKYKSPSTVSLGLAFPEL